ncbi:MAG: tRNA threonylcarbamoyladenosine dehydratase [Lachnospiraceae bacterium]|nr:tRNA threonylcarbamoyladenosine dehydratase [Lachnospiraceae bacterium]
MEQRREQLIRTELLFGEAAMERLWNSRVAVFGIGGVGGHCAEALARSGIGTIDLVDSDRVALSNLNRQLVATRSTIGKFKTEAMKQRILDINPEITVNEWRCFFLPEEQEKFPFSEYDYVVDAVDTVTAKIGLVMAAKEAGVPIISSMGAGNKIDPSKFEVADIYDTTVCPLAKVMRRELKKRGVKKLKCVYSKELPLEHQPSALAALQEIEAAQQARDAALQEIEAAQQSQEMDRPEATKGTSRRSTPGSTAFTPSVAGLILASEVIKDLSGILP